MTHTNGQDSIIEKRSILRHLVCRETDLINNRITWLLTSQTILFLAFSNFYKEFEHNNPLPVIIISALGLSITRSSASSLGISEKAVEYYRELDKEIVKENENKEKNEENSSSESFSLESISFPLDYDITKDKNRPKHNVYWFPWKRLPWLFGISWFCFLLLASFDAINQWMGIEEHFFQLFCPSNIPADL